MDFTTSYNETQEAFAIEVREWLDENVPADFKTQRSIFKMTREQYEERRELSRKLGSKGWLYAGYPPEYGGGGLDRDYREVLHREAASKGIGLPPHYDSGVLAAPTILYCGTDEQKNTFLPPILKGEKTTWQLFTEPEAGTDEANQKTDALRAVKEGENFIVNGGKIFVGNSFAPPDQFLLLTRSDLDAPRHQNLAMFLAPSDLPGIEILPLDLFPEGVVAQICYDRTANAPGHKNSVFFDNVKIPETYLIGGEQEGWKVASATLMVEHGESGASGVADGGVHIPKNLLIDKFLDQCRDNPAIRNRLEENPTLQQDMVDVYIAGHLERLYYTRNAWLPRSGKRQPHAGLQHTLHWKMGGIKLMDYMARVLGPYAFIDDEELALENDLFEMGQRCGVCVAPGGTPEALKIIMSRALRIGR